MLYTLHDKRTIEMTFTLLTSEGVPLAIDTTGTADVARVKIGKGPGTPLLDLDSKAASSNGSTVTIQTQAASTIGKIVARIDQNDIANKLWPGFFDMEVSLVDESDSQKIKHHAMHTVWVRATPGGDVGLT